MILTIIIFLVLLSVLILIHELGHFLAARQAGITVEEFGLGLPPRIWGKKIGDTIYSINALPFGGFVKLQGEDPTDEKRDLPDSFYVKSLPWRSVVIFAGVLMNFLLGVALFYLVLALTSFRAELPLFFAHSFRGVDQKTAVMIIGVEKDSPAQAAGIKPGDVILAIDSKQVTSADDLRQIIEGKKGKEISIWLKEIGTSQERIVKATPRIEYEDGPLGIGLGEIALLEYKTFGQKIFSGFSHSANTIEYSAKIFGGLIVTAVRQGKIEPVSSGVAGPIGIAQLTSEVVSLGIIPTLQFAALLSLNLAVINVLPLPALDGGRLFFLGVEAVIRRRVYPSLEKWANTVGIALLLFLILLITYNDINRIATETGFTQKVQELFK
jgi:regulator of sigma E protease